MYCEKGRTYNCEKRKYMYCEKGRTYNGEKRKYMYCEKGRTYNGEKGKQNKSSRCQNISSLSIPGLEKKKMSADDDTEEDILETETSDEDSKVSVAILSHFQQQDSTALSFNRAKTHL